jgi:hypothetical protein
MGATWWSRRARSRCGRAVDDPREHGYFSTAAPYVLAHVMRAAGIEKIEGPLVALVPGGPVWDRVRDEAEDQLVWILPHERSVELRFRPVAGVVPERPTAIREADAPAMPEPSPRPGPRYLESPPPGRACAHCGTRATRHRMAGRDALVCAACGRSFERQ